MTRGPSVTEAVLSAAIAETRAEHQAAFLALIDGGAKILNPLDRTLLLAGDGTAGRALLGGPINDAQAEPSAVRRQNRIRTAFKAASLWAFEEQDSW